MIYTANTCTFHLDKGSVQSLVFILQFEVAFLLSVVLLLAVGTGLYLMHDTVVTVLIEATVLVAVSAVCVSLWPSRSEGLVVVDVATWNVAS